MHFSSYEIILCHKETCFSIRSNIKSNPAFKGKYLLNVTKFNKVVSVLWKCLPRLKPLHASLFIIISDSHLQAKTPHKS